MFSGIGVWQLLIVLAIIILLFGTKKLRSLGGDLGSAIKNFKSSVSEGENTASSNDSSIDHAEKSEQDKVTDHDKHSS
ncbi:MAG: twin-arginine translocase subunit TatA [Gammaproteobacteria bacterium]|nr:MAG: twin-arginine translocase subunit TatA [Gammaproteobacteria bacterium]